MLTQATADPSEPVSRHAVAMSSLWQVSRPCEDFNGAFLTTLLPLSGLGCVTDPFYILICQVRIAYSLDDRPFQSLQIANDKPQTLSVAVPSRAACICRRPFGRQASCYQGPL